mmetsp:Transcript_4975/g.10871  ORF Transcript_4975/g.10871 Transcript_4975/m.10871 type:complete len:474 (+) Transcript_4975:1764-3185(+)
MPRCTSSLKARTRLPAAATSASALGRTLCRGCTTCGCPSTSPVPSPDPIRGQSPSAGCTPQVRSVNPLLPTLPTYPHLAHLPTFSPIRLPTYPQLSLTPNPLSLFPSDKELAYVEQVVADGIVSSSHFTSSCATRIAKLLGAAGKVLVVQSGTAALELAALLCNLQPGDEVILPSFTFASTANAFVLRGAVPVFVDVRRDTLNIDETLIEAAITPHTKAICCVHYAGVSCEMGAIMGIARRHKLLVIEDAAQAFMARYKGQPLGTIGDYGCFSFHYTKNIVCGEGGALVVNRSAECANRAEIVKEKGTNRNDFLLGKTSKYYWMDVGSSFVPSELSCAVLLSQLDQAEHITKTRRRIFEMYTTGLQELLQQGIQTPTVPADCYNNAHIFYILLPSPEVCGRVQDALAAAGVAAFSHYEPLHSAPAGVKYCRAVGTMEVTDTISACLLRLPIWIDLKDEQVQFVIDAVKRASTL